MATSRFDRPTYANKIMNQAAQPIECKHVSFVKNNNSGRQPPQFSAPKSVSERREFTPFGKAVDTVQNKNITTYGEDVFIEYNPMTFLGKRGIVMADTYLKNVMNSYAKSQPVTEIIVLKSEFTEPVVERDYSYLKNISEPAKQDNSKDTNKDNCTAENWDWWGDDNINDKINAQHNDYEQTPEYKCSIAELIPEVLDKLNVANKLIRDMASLNPKTLEPIKFRTLPVNTVSTTSGGRFAPVRRNIENNTDRLNTDRLNHADFDDNFSIRISNFSNPADLTTYAIKDILYEYMGDIKYKVSIPRNKETNQNKDFAFINFISEADLNKAFELLSAQRIFMDSAILYVEVSKRRAGY